MPVLAVVLCLALAVGGLPSALASPPTKYQRQQGIFTESPVVTGTADSSVVCSARCAVRADPDCGGFTFGQQDGECLLYGASLQGTTTAAEEPALSGARSYLRVVPPEPTSTPAPTTASAPSACPGSASDPCACPDGFSLCAGRCLGWQTSGRTYADAAAGCAALGAHLAVSRSEAEHQCTRGSKYGWLGITDRATEGLYEGEDGLGPVEISATWWDASAGEPHGATENCVMTGGSKPWADRECTQTYYFLCQLSGCNKPECP